MSQWLIVGRKRLIAVWCLIQAGVSIAGPIPPDHPAYKFMQIASKGPTTSYECRQYGGVELGKTTDEKNVDQGVAIVRSNGKRYLGISFGETSFTVFTTVKTCGWELN
jgi:hypothetical protein